MSLSIAAKDLLLLCRQAAGASGGRILRTDSYTCSFVPQAPWYSRCSAYALDRFPPDHIANTLQQDILRGMAPNLVTLFSPQEETFRPALETAGFLCFEEQFPMSLTDFSLCPTPTVEVDRLEADRLGDWLACANAALGKQDTDFVFSHLLRANAAYFFAVLREGCPVASAMLHISGKVAGIHKVGTDPAFRRQGFAGSLISRAVDTARQLGAECVVLQASPAGRELYRCLGFREEPEVISHWKLI